MSGSAIHGGIAFPGSDGITFYIFRLACLGLVEMAGHGQYQQELWCNTDKIFILAQRKNFHHKAFFCLGDGLHTGSPARAQNKPLALAGSSARDGVGKWGV